MSEDRLGSVTAIEVPQPDGLKIINCTFGKLEEEPAEPEEPTS